MRRALTAVKRQKSPPFISDPEVLVFRDFVVGETMTLPFTLTNISFARNTYKVKGFDKEYEALFKLDFMPPGYVSPGVSVKLSLDFTPKFNTEIRCKLHFLAETGPFDVLVECYPKVVDIQIDPFDVFDMGNVTLGEEVEKNVVIRNSGALDASWLVWLEEDMSSEHGSLTLQEAESDIQFSAKKGEVRGYGTSQFTVSFKPSRPTNVSLILRIKISSQEKEFQSFTKDLPLRSVCLDVPIFLENDLLDFGVCYYNELNRGYLVAQNRSSISHKFEIETSPTIDKFVEFMPKVGFVQAQSSLQITVKVRTSAKFLSVFAQDDEDTAVIPMKMIVQNQVLPVDFAISVTPSPTKLIFEPSSLDFGTLLTTECKEITIKITSLLQLPCDFGFVKLPNTISVSPLDGFGLVMPGETVEVVASFKSTFVKRHEFQLTCVTLQGQKFTIPGTANVVQSPITISSTKIDFEATPLGAESEYRLMITNNRHQPVDFEFDPPKDFYFDPVVSTIPPDSSVPVYIVFKPSFEEYVPEVKEEEEKDVQKTTMKGQKKPHPKPKAKDKKKPKEEDEVKEKTLIINPEFTFERRDENVCCFWRVNGGASGRHHISISASSVLPTLFVTSVTIVDKSRESGDFIDLSLNDINFGRVATGQAIDAVVTIKSVLKRTMELEFICERGSFEVLSPPARIRPLGEAKVRVRFQPPSNMKFVSNIIVRCKDRPNTRTTLHVTGEGASPSIVLNQDVLDFGNVVVGQAITRSIQVKNNADFSLKYLYELKPEPEMKHLNSSKVDAFTLKDSMQWLKPGESGEITVVFSADHDDQQWRSVLIVSAGENGETRTIPISASTWPYSMFITGGSEEPVQRTNFDHYLLDEPYFRSNVLCEMVYPGQNQVVLTFGACNQNDDIKKANGEFIFDNIGNPGFTVNPPRGNIEAGGSVKVTVEYSPPQNSWLQVGQMDIADTYVSLKCGDFSRRVPVRLKCLMNIQQSSDTPSGGKGKQRQAAARPQRPRK